MHEMFYLSNKTTKSPCFLDSQVFPSRPQGTSLHHCRNCAKAKSLPQKKHARNHMRYRHQQYTASSKDQEHNRSKQMSLGSTIMSQCCHVQADQAVTNPYRLLTSTAVMQMLQVKTCASCCLPIQTANINMMHGCSNTSSVPRGNLLWLELAWHRTQQSERSTQILHT